MLRLIALIALFGACHGDQVGNNGSLVGGDCVNNGDCHDVCQTGGDFPGGTCTVRCNNDDDCPVDTDCVQKAEGICLLQCSHPEDCRPGYTCKGVERRGAGGETLVCIKD